MKIFLMVSVIVLVLTAQIREVSAVAFTHEQLDKIVDYLSQNPATTPENTATLKLDAAQLKDSFNAALEPILSKAQFESDEEREIMEKLFYIKEFQIFESDEGNLYMNVFGDSVAIFGVTGTDNSRFKLLSCAYTMPETQNDNTLSSLVLASFVQSLLPTTDVETFLRELSSEQSGNVNRDGVKFSLGRDGNLILLSAVKGN